MRGFAPLRRTDGYLPIEDHGLVGDGETAALVARDGSIPWLCVPRFDSPPLFAAILDVRDGGAFTVAPEGVQEARQSYDDDTAVVVTEFRTPEGLVRLEDALTVRAGADLREHDAVAQGELVRRVRSVRGRARVRIAFAPGGGASASPAGDALRVRCDTRPELDLRLASNVPLAGLDSTVELDEGGEVVLSLRWGSEAGALPVAEAGRRLDATREAWRRWITCVTYLGRQEALVRRSLITLKLLDHFHSGAIVAAPTSSLPEAIGGPRNWDYRYTWIRDAAFSVYAFHRMGLEREAEGFLRWVLDAMRRHGAPKVLYTLDGDAPPPEREDALLHGYRGSAPVRWGNAASDQVQHDIYGEIVDCAYQWVRHHGTCDEALWNALRRLADRAATAWREPDRGIWEVRSAGRPFTYSAAACQVALDRAARLASWHDYDGDLDGWRASAEDIRRRIIEDAWSPKHQAFVEHLDGTGGLDASLLTLPLRRVVPAEHPRMVATATAVAHGLSAGDGLLYRYLPHKSPDGLPGDEGAFLLCSFWLVDNLSMQGRREEALDLFDRLCARANPLGLLPEQIDPASGAFLGNFPQAFSHIGLISSAVNLARGEPEALS